MSRYSIASIDYAPVLVSFGERKRLPRPLSVVAVVAAVFGVLVLAGFMVAGEAASLAREFPDYRVNGL